MAGGKIQQQRDLALVLQHIDPLLEVGSLATTGATQIGLTLELPGTGCL